MKKIKTEKVSLATLKSLVDEYLQLSEHYKNIGDEESVKEVSKDLAAIMTTITILATRNKVKVDIVEGKI